MGTSTSLVPALLLLSSHRVSFNGLISVYQSLCTALFSAVQNSIQLRGDEHVLLNKYRAPPATQVGLGYEDGGLNGG